VLQVKSWLPQQDILAHPNVKLFVTHGGLFSLLEGLYHGTRLVGLPLATDQFANMGRAKVFSHSSLIFFSNLQVNYCNKKTRK
jgi:glucuronosyltransferase